MIERLGKYRIVGTIGQGGMGTVYRALDPVLDRQVALKVVSSDGELSAEQKARLLREAKACAQLTHPNVISIYDLGEDAGHVFIVMELLHGQDLKRLIAAHATVSVVEKLALMIQVCDGLHYAHQQGIVHRDIKPANIFVLPNGGLKILDFGLAHLTTSDPTLTQTGQILGTLPYMAPERFRGLGDYRGDIFAVGAVCYELLTGRRAFVAETAVQLIEMIRTAHPPPLASMDASLPPELAAAVELALQKEPGARFADLGGMRTALDQVRQRLLNPGAARTLFPTVPSPADAKPPVVGDVPDTVSADHPPASTSRPRTATLVGRFATQFRRFRLAISISFTVTAAIAVYFVNLPHYADIGTSPVPVSPPMTDSQPYVRSPMKSTAPESLPSERPIQSPIPEANAKKQIARDEQARKREEALLPPPAVPGSWGAVAEKAEAEWAAVEQRQESQRQEAQKQSASRLGAQEAQRQETHAPIPVPSSTQAKSPTPVPPPAPQTQRQEAQWQETQRQETQRQETQRQETQRLAAQKQETQKQETQKQEAQKQEAQRQEAQRQEAQRVEAQRVASAERERQRQGELVAAARRGIEQSRSRMVARREDAVKADAGRLAKSIFDAAEKKQAEAETLVSRQSFSDADHRYQDATELYFEAKVRAEAISEAKKQADGAKVQMLTEKQRASTGASEYAQAQNEERQANALYERSSYNEAAEKYRSTAMLYATPAAGMERARAQREAEVRSAVASYKRAIESKDLALLQKVWPGLSEADLERFKESFARLESRNTEMTIDDVQIQGGTAEVKTRETDAHVADEVPGTPSPETTHVFRLRRAPTGDWVIVSVQ